MILKISEKHFIVQLGVLVYSITNSIKLQERPQRERDRDRDQCFESEKPTIIDFNEQVTSFVNSRILQIAYVFDSKPPLIPN